MSEKTVSKLTKDPYPVMDHVGDISMTKTSKRDYFDSTFSDMLFEGRHLSLIHI